jgi:hypothetical protein
MKRRRLIELLVVRWGFAAMVAVAIAMGIIAGATVAPPSDVPAVSLRAVAVYRMEVGAAVFLGLYLATMALVLAMHNRGFTEIGSGGIRAQDLAAASDGLVAESVAMELIEELAEQQAVLREGERDVR